MHRGDHKQNPLTTCAAAALVLAVGACAPMTRIDPPAPLGALIDRPPPRVSVATNGTYPNPLGEPVPPILTADVADAIVGEPLRLSLSPTARQSVAIASLSAATAPTGTPVLWKSAASSGAVIPMHDAYRSLRGRICRDLQQQAQDADGPSFAQVTLCRMDAGDGRIEWLPSPID